MKKQAGFTLIELAVLVAIVAIVSAIAIPNMISWMSRSRVRAGARDIVAMIQKARIEAVRQNGRTVVTFDSSLITPPNIDYLAFLDDGQGTADADANGIPDGAGNGTQDGTERTIYRGRLPAGVTLDNVPFGAGAGTTSFNTRAIPSFAGPIALANGSGYTVTITVGSGGIPTVN